MFDLIVCHEITKFNHGTERDTHALQPKDLNLTKLKATCV